MEITNQDDLFYEFLVNRIQSLEQTLQSIKLNLETICYYVLAERKCKYMNYRIEFTTSYVPEHHIFCSFYDNSGRRVAIEQIAKEEILLYAKTHDIQL